MKRAILVGSACVVLVVAASGCGGENRLSGELRRTVSSAKAPEYLKAPRWKLVRQVYRDRKYRPLWMDGRRVGGDGRDLIETLCHAEREGLRVSDYDLAGLRTALERLNGRKGALPAELAALDLRLTSLFIDYGADLLAGRLDPSAVDNGWYIRARRASIDSSLRAALRAGDFDDMVSPLRPRQREYRDLLGALADYRKIAAQGDWPRVPAGERLRLGDRGPRVAALKERLRASGDLGAPAKAKPVYDAKVAAAVGRFQQRHGIPEDSAVGPATLAALNVSAATRVRQIELNLERYRWLPSDFGKRYILVNIPDYQLYAYDDGKEVLRMRVIVGEEYGNATPVFADSMTYLVFRPHWEIPSRILVDEVIPRVRENIYYLAEHGYEVVDTKSHAVVADPSTIDWSDVDTTDLQFRVRQKSGDGNALGRVKFMFPNQFDIYLHDTPRDDLFDRPRRTLSHGCVRVEDPLRLAGYVLAPEGWWSETKIRDAMAPGDSTETGTPLTVGLKHPVPVYLVYLTAFVRDGQLNFRDDPYGKDRQALGRMGKPSAEAGQCDELARLAAG
jgi:murein L,D-transpeptidase YcbB/YkuD